MTRLQLAAALLLTLAPAAGAQQPKPGTPAPSAPTTITEREMMVAAYSLRRSGEFASAAAAFDELLQLMAKGPEKRLIGAEAAELYRVTGRLDRALQLYRNNHDFAGEFDVLFTMGRVQEALTVARLVKYAKGEADALVHLGRVDEALRIYEEKGLRKEKAAALARAGRWVEAAAAYGALNDFYAQAQALEAARDAAGAKRAYQDAKIQLADDLRNELIPRKDGAEQQVQRAVDGIARERARLRLARVLGQVSEAYEKLALVYTRTDQPAEKAAGMVLQAKRSTERQRDTLLDTASGKPDLYGQKAVAHQQLAERIAALEQKAQEYAQARVGPPPAPPAPPPTPPRRR